MMFDQSAFDIRCEWGANGVRQLAPISDAIIIVDILSFSTCVTIATSRGARIFPYPFHDATRIDEKRLTEWRNRWEILGIFDVA
jgi:2-phosphosulfolactate phosphatase